MLSPSGNRWQVILLEDADRLTEDAANALLKAIEEPAERTVWLLCAPSADDLVPTIRSRCRLMVLRTPTRAAVADVSGQARRYRPAMARLRRPGVRWAHRSGPAARDRRGGAAASPGGASAASAAGDIGSCITAAANLVDAATEEAVEATAGIDATETEG